MKNLLLSFILLLTFASCTEEYLNQIEIDTSDRDSLLLIALNHKDSVIVIININDTIIVNNDTIIVPDTTTVIQPPLAYTVTQPTCSVATGSIALTGLPITGVWTINPFSITGTGTNKTISGLASGTYNIVVTNTKGYISPTINVTINSQPLTPTAPTIRTTAQPTCNITTGSVTLEGLPALGNWVINPGNITGTGTSKIVSGLASGTYNYTVTNDVGCISPSVTVTINPQPLTPTTPTIKNVTQPTCSVATGSVTLDGLPVLGNWTINSNITGTGTSKTITGLVAGTYNYSVTNSVGCNSPSVTVIINPQPLTPTAPIIGLITQPTSDVATGSVVLTGLPTTGTWTITKLWGTNKISFTGTGASVTVRYLDPKGTGDVKCYTTTYNFTVTNENGCTSPLSNDVVINSYN